MIARIVCLFTVLVVFAAGAFAAEPAGGKATVSDEMLKLLPFATAAAPVIVTGSEVVADPKDPAKWVERIAYKKTVLGPITLAIYNLDVPDGPVDIAVPARDGAKPAAQFKVGSKIIVAWSAQGNAVCADTKANQATVRAVLFPGWGTHKGMLCPRCRLREFAQVQGRCGSCGLWTSSRQHKLCGRCGQGEGACQAQDCKRKLGPATPDAELRLELISPRKKGQKPTALTIQAGEAPALWVWSCGQAANVPELPCIGNDLSTCSNLAFIARGPGITGEEPVLFKLTKKEGVAAPLPQGKYAYARLHLEVHPDGVAFQEPGTYTVRAVAGRLSSNLVTIIVKPGEDKPATGDVVRRAAAPDLLLGLGSGLVDATAKPKLPAEGIVLPGGSSFPCSIGRSAGDGCLSLTAPFLKQPGAVLLNGLDHVSIPTTQHEDDGPELVRLTNGDTIFGEVEFDTDEIAVKTKGFGTLTLPMSIVRSIERVGKSPLLIATDFRRHIKGQDGWTYNRTQWIAKDTGLHSLSVGPMFGRIIHRVKHDGPVTFVAEVDGTTAKPFVFYMSLFMPEHPESLDAPWPKKEPQRLTVVFGAAACRILGNRSKDYKGIMVKTDALATCKGEVRVAWDPKESKIRVWVGEKLIIDDTVPHIPKTGQFVSLMASADVKILNARMYTGMRSPGATMQRPDVYCITMLNGSVVAATGFEIDEDQMLAETPGGEIRVPLDRIVHIAPPGKKAKIPATNAEDVRLHLTHSAITAKLESLTPEQAVVTTAWGAKITIPRAAISRISGDPRGTRKATAPAGMLVLADGARMPVASVQFSGEDVTCEAPWVKGSLQVDMRKISHLVVNQSVSVESGADVITLTDGSRVTGTLTGVSADAFTLRTDGVGVLSIPRKHVVGVASLQTNGLVVNNDFTAGDLGKWDTVLGEWALRQNGVSARWAFSPLVMALALKQNKPVTLELKANVLKSAVGGSIVLFAAKPSLSVTARGGLTLTYSDKQSQWFFGNPMYARRVGRGPLIKAPGGIVTVSYDPQKGRIKVWKDGVAQKSPKAWNGAERGRYVMLHHSWGCEFERVRIWEGVVPPTPLAKAVAGHAIVTDRKGNELPLTDMALADGHLTGVQGAEKVKLAWAGVSRIATAADGHAGAAPNGAHTRVRLAQTELVMQVTKLDDKFLEGASATLGKLRIPRASVRWIQNVR